MSADTTYHAPDCWGGCDGCGYITWRQRWLPGPPPWWARRFQRLRSEFGVRFVLVEWSDGTLTVVTR